MTDSRDADTLPASASQQVVHRARARLAALTIAHHPDSRRVGERALILQQESGDGVRLARHELHFGHPGAAQTAPLTDPRLSRTPVLLDFRDGELRIEIPDRVEVRIDERPATGAARLGAPELERGAILELARRVTLLAHFTTVGTRGPRYRITGESTAIEEVRRAIHRVADLTMPVLVRGQTGVGKERVAEAIHRASGRAGAWVAVNVATLPPTLAAAELFGHAKGAFTGATEAKAGLFERANGGTLFLDEIGELSMDVQAMLLRALERGEVRRLGTERDRPIDVRVVSATDADLEARVAGGSFREALLHRLRGFEIEVPSLRRRREDIPRLVVEILAEELAATVEQHRLDAPGTWLERGLMNRLLQHEWPGNVRQLRGVLRQLVVASRGEPALVADASVLRTLAEGVASTSAALSRPHERGSELTPQDVLTALEVSGFSFSRAARRLGLSKAAFYRLAAAHPSVPMAGDLSAEELRAALAEHGDVVRAAAALRVSVRALKLRLTALGLRELG